MPVMAKPGRLTFLATLQSWQLKHLAYLVGLKSTGTKAQLKKSLTDCMNRPALPTPRCRILSIDMGVKNLAFCLLDLHSTSQKPDEDQNRNSLAFHLSDWRRMDVSERLIQKHTNPPGAAANQISSGNLHGEPKESSTELVPEEQLNLYTPSSLSKIAFGLASEFMQYQPDFILIERQRFRSGGAPAIQEWTVRVNMLESMLWASLETMRHGYDKGVSAHGRRFPDVLEMSPRRIGMFWLARGDVSAMPADVASSLAGPKEKIQTTESALAKRSYEKKDKIALARHWLCTPMDNLTIDPKLGPMVGSFCSPPSRRRKKDTETEDEDIVEVKSGSGKLDDLADCLVQAVTFALWEQNRMNVRNHIEMNE